MLRFARLAALALALPLVVLAQGPPSHATVIESLIKLMNDASDSVGKISDKATAEKATDDLKKQTETLKKLKVDADKLGPPTADQAKEVETKFKDKMGEAGKRIQKEMTAIPQKIMALPMETQLGLGNALKDWGAAMQAVGKAIEPKK